MENRVNFAVIGGGALAAIVLVIAAVLIFSGGDDNTPLAVASPSATASIALSGTSTAATTTTTPATATPDAGLQSAENERLGVEVEQITAALVDEFDLSLDEGVVVTDVDAGSAAAIAQLRAADIVLSIDDAEIDTVSTFQSVMASLAAGRQVDIEVQRGEDQRVLTATLDAPLIDELVRGLPGAMRLNVEQQIRDGELSIDDVQELVDTQQSASRAALVIEADADSLRATTYLGEEFTVELTDDTVIRRGSQDIAPGDLAEDEMVLVLSRDGGLTAFAIQSFGLLGSDLP